MTDEKLIKALREEERWARANEWEAPITLADHLSFAAERIEELTLEIKELKKQCAQNSLKKQIMIDQGIAMSEQIVRERNRSRELYREKERLKRK